MAVRIIRGYRTIFFKAAACFLAGTPPWEIDAEVLSDVYWQRQAYRRQGECPSPEESRRSREVARDALIRQYEERIAGPSAGHGTIEAIRPTGSLYGGGSTERSCLSTSDLCRSSQGMDASGDICVMLWGESLPLWL